MAAAVPVPPEGDPADPASVDFLQPGGIYRDVRLRVVPVTYLSDVFARPADVLTAHRGVDVRCTIDTAAAPNAPVRITAELSGPGARRGASGPSPPSPASWTRSAVGSTATASPLTRLGRHLAVVTGQPGPVRR